MITHQKSDNRIFYILLKGGEISVIIVVLGGF